MPAPLEASGISKRFGKTEAVVRASLAVGPGVALGLVGPNGSGKTTLLRCASGLLRMDEGSSRILGHDVTLDHPAAMEGIAFVPELPAPFPSLTPMDHLRFAARVYRLGPGWEERAARILQSLELSDRADHLCQELSKGQRQKVHLAEAMLRDPPLVVLDEPLIGIDPKGVRVLKDFLREGVSKGRAYVLSSHTLPFVQEVCSRVAVIDHGRILADGTLDDLRSRSHAGGGTSLEDVFLKLTEAEPADGALR